MVQQQVLEKKELKCRYGCGTSIEFDQFRRSKSNKLLPIEVASGIVHSCPNSPYNQKQQKEEPKVNGESQSVTKQPEEDTVFSLLMEINKKMDIILDQFEALK